MDSVAHPTAASVESSSRVARARSPPSSASHKDCDAALPTTKLFWFSCAAIRRRVASSADTESSRPVSSMAERIHAYPGSLSESLDATRRRSFPAALSESAFMDTDAM